MLAAGCGDDEGGGSSTPAQPELLLATTTSTVDSGLLDELVPVFENETGYEVKPLALGSGEALELAGRGEADVVLVHSPSAEEEFMATGVAGERRLVMHNRFMIIGPKDDPAGVAQAAGVTDAMLRIADAQAVFISRGDDSGTNAFELKQWEAAGIEPNGAWYQLSGQGMAATIQIAAEKGGYTISDNATQLATAETSGLASLYDRGAEMLNIYHVIELTDEAGADVNVEGGQAFADFLVSEEAQRLIEEFGVSDHGEPLFVPDAGKTDEEVTAPA